MTDADTTHLRRAIALARDARASGHRPFGALVVLDGEVIAQAASRRPQERDATAHSELRVLSAASQAHTAETLANATLYASTEPCAMCAAAAYWSGVGRLVFGLSESRLRAMTGANPKNPTLDLPCRELFARGQRAIEVLGPCLEDEAIAPHQGYWN